MSLFAQAAPKRSATWRRRVPRKQSTTQACKHLPRYPPAIELPQTTLSSPAQIAPRTDTRSSFHSKVGAWPASMRGSADNVLGLLRRLQTPQRGDQRRQLTRALPAQRARSPRHIQAYHNATATSHSLARSPKSPAFSHTCAPRKYASTRPHQRARNNRRVTTHFTSAVARLVCPWNCGTARVSSDQRWRRAWRRACLAPCSEAPYPAPAACSRVPDARCRVPRPVPS